MFESANLSHQVSKPAYHREEPKLRAALLTDNEWKYFKLYNKFVKVCEPFLRKTSTGEAPWIVVAGADPRYRALTVGRHLLAAMRERLDEKPVKRLPDKTPQLLPAADNLNVLRALKLDQPLTKTDYEKQLEKWQGRLNVLSRHPRFKNISVVMVFEGNDAAGKGGAIRRLTAALDARSYHSVPVPPRPRRSAPSRIYGASGGMFRVTAGSPFSIARGTGGCWWSVSKDSVPRATGCAPIPRSTIWSSSSPGRISWSSNTGWPSARMSN